MSILLGPVTFTFYYTGVRLPGPYTAESHLYLQHRTHLSSAYNNVLMLIAAPVNLYRIDCFLTIFSHFLSLSVYIYIYTYRIT
jgi:hypothetical protein